MAAFPHIPPDPSVKSPVSQVFRLERLLGRIIECDEQREAATPGTLAKELQVTERTIGRMVTRLKVDHDIQYDRTLRRYLWKGRKNPHGLNATDPLCSWDIGMALLLADAAGREHPAGKQIVEHLRRLGVPTHMLSTRLPLATADIGRGIETVPDPIFQAILGAATMNCSLKGYYQKAGSRAGERRHFVPRHLCLLSGRWTAISYDLDRKEHRNFLVGRFTSVPSFDVPIEETTLPPFDLNEYLGHDFGRFHGDEVLKVVLVFEREAVPSLQERYWRRGQEIELLPDGRARFRFTATHLADVCRWVLSWNGSAWVEAPEKLRTMVAQTATQILNRHQSCDTVSK